MNSRLKSIESGTVTTVQGFVAGAVIAGIKKQDILDLAILCSKTPCTAAAVFTTNAIKSAPVLINQQHLQNGKAQAIVVNSGYANACTANKGMAAAEEMAKSVAKKLDISSQDVIVASTGVIGIPLPMDKIKRGIEEVVLTEDGGHEMAQAMMTTDTFAKEIAVQVQAEPKGFTVGGVAKGAGMIHPNMATMLCFLTTDAAADAEFLQSALKKSVDSSFNMITIDGDTSPSDTVAILANGLARNQPLSKANGKLFQKALDKVCLYLAKSIARDGEGATKLMEVIVEGAMNEIEARLAARTIASSPLVKTAIHGNDPNWGRIVSALGRSGARVTEAKLDAYLNSICVMKQGHPLPFDKQQASASLNNKEVLLRVNLNLGQGKAIAWGCDLSAEYVNINSAYTT
ncbi:MAG: bifunctional glutamate N-acetyltransferase/amino-acid acetyltransferase ArgJ [Chloroflexi bacterium]|nr:bifunctional glutamate N-acetyltransferase/amino-acid acetyltransferase ArgJ [Chloroflexota bacterium]MBM3183661.1 bifunctional glutamate N-acetyltransferase/amino-acid acetyltransferase ArgJ [Chloroflexota bacterium]